MSFKDDQEVWLVRRRGTVFELEQAKTSAVDLLSGRATVHTQDNCLILVALSELSISLEKIFHTEVEALKWASKMNYEYADMFFREYHKCQGRLAVKRIKNEA